MLTVVSRQQSSMISGLSLCAEGSLASGEICELDDAVTMQAGLQAEALADLEEVAALDEVIAVHGNDALKVLHQSCDLG